jgi:hypothetical protein
MVNINEIGLFIQKSMTETELIHLLLDATSQSDNIRLFRRNVGAFTRSDNLNKKRFYRFGTVGQSDLYGLVNIGCSNCGSIQLARHIEIECKVKNNHVTQFQQEWIETIRQFGGIAITITDKDFSNLVGYNSILNQLFRIILNQSPPFCYVCSPLSQQTKFDNDRQLLKRILNQHTK